MKNYSHISRQIILLSMIVLVVPIIVFPERFGIKLMQASLFNVAYELIYYILVVYFFNRQSKFMQSVQSSLICLTYRFALGFVFGLLVVAMYPMNIAIGLQLGMLNYTPVVLLHIIVTPFILKPLLNKLNPVMETSHTEEKTQMPIKTFESTVTSIAASKEKGFSQEVMTSSDSKDNRKSKTEEKELSAKTMTLDANGFDKATRYIGEDGSIQMAAIVDNEGLLLSSFTRGGVIAEDVAPFALSLLNSNDNVWDRMGFQTPEKIDMLFSDKKVVVAAEDLFCLMVISERTFDEVLNIRINQGIELIRKYVAERYSKKLFGNAERKTYV